MQVLFCALCLMLDKLEYKVHFLLLKDYLDLPVLGGDSNSENDSDEKSDIIEGDDSLWLHEGTYTMPRSTYL